MCSYTLKWTFIDNGDPNCEQRKWFENYINYFWKKGSHIETCIKNYDVLIDEKANNLFKYSNTFFMLSIYNLFAISAIELAAFLTEYNSASIDHFLNFCEQNQKFIFTKEFYVEKINVPESKKIIKMGEFRSILEKSRQLLLDNATLIEKIKNDREKVFAHFDRDFIVTHKWEQSITIDDLKNALNIVKTIVNDVGKLYDNSIRDFSPISVSDIDNTIYILGLYDKNTRKIQELRLKGDIL